MKLRQIALAASHLQPWRARLFELLEISADFKDPGVAEFGLENSVMAIGTTFLEIVAPTRPDTAAGRLLQRRNSVACGYMALLQVDDFAHFNAHLDTLGVRRVWEIDRADVSACHVHPKDIGGAIVSFDEMRPPGEWVWGGPDWRDHQAGAATRIVGCTLQSPRPKALHASWARVMGSEPRFDDGTFIEFIGGDGYEGICTLVLQTEDPDALYRRAETLDLGEPGVPALGDLHLRFVE